MLKQEMKGESGEPVPRQPVLLMEQKPAVVVRKGQPRALVQLKEGITMKKEMLKQEQNTKREQAMVRGQRLKEVGKVLGQGMADRLKMEGLRMKVRAESKWVAHSAAAQEMGVTQAPTVTEMMEEKGRMISNNEQVKPVSKSKEQMAELRRQMEERRRKRLQTELEAEKRQTSVPQMKRKLAEMMLDSSTTPVREKQQKTRQPMIMMEQRVTLQEMAPHTKAKTPVQPQSSQQPGMLVGKSVVKGHRAPMIPAKPMKREADEPTIKVESGSSVEEERWLEEAKMRVREKQRRLEEIQSVLLKGEETF